VGGGSELCGRDDANDIVHNHQADLISTSLAAPADKGGVLRSCCAPQGSPQLYALQQLAFWSRWYCTKCCANCDWLCSRSSSWFWQTAQCAHDPT
jgi:hypothetical protein